MKNINSCCAALVLALAIVVTPAARGQTTDDDSQVPAVCTDLTGKVPLPCPTSGDAVKTLSDEEDSTTTPPPKSASAPRAAGKHASREKKSDLAAAPSANAGSAAGPSAKSEPAAASAVVSAQPEPSQPAIHPASAPQPMGSEGDPRASIGLYPKTPPEPDPDPVQPANAAAARSSLIRDVTQDQKYFWTSPLRLRLNDVQWIAPLLAGSAITVASDTAIEAHLPTSTSLQTRSKSYSTYGAAAFAAAAGGAFLLGTATHNDHMRETGLLSGEAALDSFGLTYAIKSITNRDRPYQGNGRGNFFSNGDSFPSEHAAAAWSIATVIAHEYPGPLTTLFAYGGAASVSAARVLARQHFTSDALIGSAIGYFVGRQLYKAHHEREDMTRYGTFQRAPADRPPSPDNMGSAFVPLDSWVYDAFDRLAALGYVHTAFAGLKPWTRMECIRLLAEADSAMQVSNSHNDAAAQLFSSLKAEFAFDAETIAAGRNIGAQVESLYTRVTGISGTPLRDGYHFGQTIINDYGRPYEEGFNMATGFSTRAEAGPLAFYVRGEYQHSPSGPALPDSARQTVATVDFLPSAPPDTPVPTTDRFRLLDAYVALNLHNWQVSAGKQSLSWGPGLGGSMMFSNNVEPIDMIRFDRVRPIQLPWIFRFLGPVRTEFFLGQLSRYVFIQSPSGLVGQFGRSLESQPFIHGQKLSFKPTSNLEFGFSRTTIYGGPGYPFTERTLFRSLFSTGNTLAGAANKPGDRRSGMDFTYRLPGLRNWVSFYGDGFTEDEYSPVAYADRSIWRAGLYVSHFPRLSKLDLRTEG
ncbi:MAG TPA: capsule assembly Wzi family protein, partial [Terriglobales bacterium]